MSGFPSAVDYGNSIWARRYFWASLVMLDLRTRYRRSLLGMGWTLANPVAMTIVLSVVFHTLFGVELREYIPFVLSGMAFWNYFSGSIIEGCSCLYAGEAYIRSTPSPVAVYSLRTTLGLTIHFLVVFALTIVVGLIFRGPSALLGLPSLLIALPLLFGLCWSLATIFGFLNVFYPDVQHLSTIVMQLLFYLSPIFCPPELLINRGMGALVRFNPISYFLELVRMPLLHGSAPSLTAVGVSVGTTAVSALIAWRIIRKHEQTIVFHM